MTSLEWLRRLWEHGEWADDTVLAALRALPEPPADAVREFAHVLGAKEVWISRLAGRPSRLPVWPDLSLAQLTPMAETVRTDYRTYLDRLGDDDLARTVAYTNSAGRSFDTAIGEILSHVVLHGQYHRGKVNVMLRAAGAQPAPVDFITYVRGAPAATTR